MLPVNVHTVPRLCGFLLNKLMFKVEGLKPRPLYGPQTICLEVCRSCNLDCPMCLRTLLPPKERHGYMPFEDIKKILKDIGHSVIGIGLGGWGEPMLHPNFIEILQTLSSEGLLISFNTNGALLKDYAGDLLKVRTLYHVGISFDFIPGTLNKAHSLIEALEGVQLLMENKGKRKYPLVRVTATIMKCNVHMLPELVRLISRYGATWFDCHEVIIFDAQKFNGPYAPPSREELIYYFRKAKEEGVRLGIKVTYNRKYKDPHEVTGQKKVCIVPWTSMFIDFKGYAHPCCYYLHLNLGQWKGKDFCDFRLRLLEHKDRFCNNCMDGNMYRNWTRI